VPPHFVFESLGYLIGGQLYWWRRRLRGDTIPGLERFVVAGAAIFGAALGSRLLAALENPAHLTLEGKTIVGGLIGGLIGVELIKKALGVTRSTGDLFAIPLTFGIAIGRIGCFLTGLPDQTHGSPTELPWGYDYGDGVRRHPTQLYEIAYLMLLALALSRFHAPREGDEFRLFMVGYMAFRLAIDFLKPGVPILGLTAIQWACLGILAYYSRDIRRWIGRTPA
jgi:phosphatidylglycerol---prolipoprotein diacylglyceryl transferase